jgi:trans-2,3-dihydro-3-hydroxyanthranilate isomerase
VPQRHRYLLADVFTDRPFGGNPLAVFLDGAAVPECLMQPIARELNLSETVFVLPPASPAHAARLRIFTPGAELPFAGHPTVGTAILLAERGALGPSAIDADNAIDVILEEQAGLVPVRIERSKDAPATATLTSPRIPERGPALPPRDGLARLLGVPAEALATPFPAEAWSTGVPFAIVPVRDEAALDAATLDLSQWRDALAQHWAPHLFLITVADWRAGSEVAARMFAPALGIAEDPATGAAAAALGGYLAAHQRRVEGWTRWRIRQGEAMGRPSLIHLRTELREGALRRVEVGGSAVLIGEGELILPR